MATDAVVLIVDDDADLRQTLADELAHGGYRVAVAANGEKALEYLRESGTPKLILLDLMMPVMDGHQFLAAYRTELGLPPTTVFLITARGVLEKPDYTDLGVDAIFRKPFDIKALLTAIQRAMSE